MSRILNGGYISRHAENEIRRHLGLDDLPEYQQAPVCPVHGVVHAKACRQRQPADPIVAKMVEGLLAAQRPPRGERCYTKDRERIWLNGEA